MTRVVSSLIFALGFFAVLIGIAYRVYADVVAGPDHATLANQGILRDLLPPDATRISVLAFERSMPPMREPHSFAIHQVFFRTDVDLDTLQRRWADVLASNGWAHPRVIGARGSDPSQRDQSWCRGAVAFGSGGAAYVALTGPLDRDRCPTGPALTEQLSDSTVDAVVGTLPFVGYLAVAYRARASARRLRGPTRTTARGLAHHVVALAWMPYAVLLVRPLPEVPPPQFVRLFGLIIAIAGIAVAVWALRTLGRHFDVELEVHAGHELVRSGPFGIVRHPVYTGLALHFLGACLATGNVLLILGTLFGSFPAFYLRARAEERLLREEFGAEYDAYAKRVGMLVPFL
jgi:protein-S-isoprenylcysteine O-methyltransferase Ste14